MKLDALFVVNVALFVPCVLVLLLTLINLIRSCQDVDYSTHPQWKILTMICYIMHSASITLYFLILPLNYLNKSFDLNLLSIGTYTPFLIMYNLWVLIIISMCLLQMVRGYMIVQLSRNNQRYNYSIFVILMMVFISLWIMLYIWRSQHFVDYLVSWFIIIVYVYLSFLLYYKPIKICMLAARTILKWNYDDNRYKAKPFMDMLSIIECILLTSGWIRINMIDIFIPIDIKNLCAEFIYVGMERTDKDIMVMFHGYNISIYLKKRIEANSRMIFVFIVIGVAQLICVILYCMKIILYGNNEFVVLMIEIGIYLCLLLEILCNNYVPGRNRLCYAKICMPCKYYMDRCIMKKTAPVGVGRQYTLMTDNQYESDSSIRIEQLSDNSTSISLTQS